MNIVYHVFIMNSDFPASKKPVRNTFRENSDTDVPLTPWGHPVHLRPPLSPHATPLYRKTLQKHFSRKFSYRCSFDPVGSSSTPPPCPHLKRDPSVSKTLQKHFSRKFSYRCSFDLTQTHRQTNYFFSQDPPFSRGNIQS